MTESGAHLSSVAAASDSNLPSVFEVIAQASLVSTLKPALHHVLRVRVCVCVLTMSTVHVLNWSLECNCRWPALAAFADKPTRGQSADRSTLDLMLIQQNKFYWMSDISGVVELLWTFTNRGMDNVQIGQFLDCKFKDHMFSELISLRVIQSVSCPVSNLTDCILVCQHIVQLLLPKSSICLYQWFVICGITE